MSLLREHQTLQVEALHALFRQELPEVGSALYRPAVHHFNNPGKLFRARLALSSATAVGLNSADSLLWAAACELLHNASLVHDDISDASCYRRGQESVNKKFGSDTALCLGDWMIAKAFELAARSSHNGGELVALLAASMQRTCIGQISDITQARCPTLAEWKKVASGKTAPLLLAPIKGAVTTSQLDVNLTALEELIELCGLAYQGRNDIDDIVPSSHRSSDLDGRNPNLVVCLYSTDAADSAEFIRWYDSLDVTMLVSWQRRIASHPVILTANQYVESWLVQAESLVASLPSQLQPVALQLVSSVKQEAVVDRRSQLA